MCKHKVIYSKRFPRQSADELLKSCETPDDIPPTESFESFYKRITENSTYVLKPERVKGREKFINIAKKLSTSYEIDAEITDFFHYVCVTLYLNCTSCTGELKSMFTELVVMCDRISSFIINDDPCDFIITLDYDTHDRYISGRKVQN